MTPPPVMSETNVRLRMRPPSAEVRAAVQRLLRFGCAASAVDAPFGGDPTPEHGGMAIVEAASWEEVQLPCLIIGIDGEPQPMVEGFLGWWEIVVRIEFAHQATAPADWVQAVLDKLWELGAEVMHQREAAAPTEQTPLALRLTAAAAEALPAIPLHVAHAEPVSFTGPTWEDDQQASYEFKWALVAGVLAPPQN